MRVRAVRLLPVIILAACCGRDPFSGAPRLMVVAADRAEDLRFLDPADAGVALLSGRIVFSDRAVRLEPRQAPFYLPPGKPYLIATYDVLLPVGAVGGAELEAGARLISKQSNEHFFRAVQLKADVQVDGRNTLRELLIRVRPQLRSHQMLAVVVPEKACADTQWIDSLPVDLVVPIATGDAEKPGISRCRGSAYVRFPFGSKTAAAVRGARRIWVESAQAWTPAELSAVRGILHR